MGRKSKKSATPVSKPACFYCTRSFDSEDVLIQHQKLTHFKCPECGKKFGNAPGMSVHMKTMHDIELQTVPKSELGRDDPTLHIIGSSGVPTEEEWEESIRKRTKVSALDSLVDSVTAEALDEEGAEEVDPLLVKGMVYSDEQVSQEEKRAQLAKYRVDALVLEERLAGLEAMIGAKLQALSATARKVVYD